MADVSEKNHLLPDEMRNEFGALFVRVADTEGELSADQEALHARGVELFAQLLPDIQAVVTCSGPQLMPLLVVHPGAQLSNSGTCCATRLHECRMEIHLAVNNPLALTYLRNAFTGYANDLPDFDTSRTGRNGKKRHDEVEHKDIASDHHADSDFIPGHVNHTQKRRNTTIDLVAYRKAPQQERDFWIRYLLEDESISPKDFLRSLRVVNGLSTIAMGKLLGIPQSSYSGYENVINLSAAHCKNILIHNFFHFPTAIWQVGDDLKEAVNYDIAVQFAKRFGYSIDAPSIGEPFKIPSKRISFPETPPQAYAHMLQMRVSAYLRGDATIDDVPDIITALHVLMKDDLIRKLPSFIKPVSNRSLNSKINSGLTNEEHKALLEILPAIGKEYKWSTTLVNALSCLPYTRSNTHKKHVTRKPSSYFSQNTLLTELIEQAKEISNTAYDADSNSDMTLPQFLAKYLTCAGSGMSDVARKEKVKYQNITLRHRERNTLTDTIIQRIIETNSYDLPTDEQGVVREDIQTLLYALNNRVVDVIGKSSRQYKFLQANAENECAAGNTHAMV